MTLAGKLFTICVTDNLGLEIGDRDGSVAWVTAADTAVPRARVDAVESSDSFCRLDRIRQDLQ